MAERKKPAGKPIIDVAHPGKSAPSQTSKPVIITNRTILKDPMMVETSDDKPSEKSVKSTAPTLTPAAAKAALDEPTEAPVQAEAPAESAPEPAPKPKPVPEPEPEAKAKPEPEKPEKAEEPEAPAEETPVEAENTGPVEDAAAAEAAEKAAAEHDATVQKLVDSKQYYLPINSVEKRRSRRFVLLGVLVAILLALAWVDIALDAGLLHINNVQPLTHFFSN